MNILTVAAVVIITSIISVLIKQYRPEYSSAITITVSVLLLTVIFLAAQPAINKVKSLVETAGVSGEYAGILLKALGICYLTQFASDSCKDAGENSLASKAELGGKIAIILLALPLIDKIISISMSFLER